MDAREARAHNRRQALSLVAATAAALLLPRTQPAGAGSNADALIQHFTAGRRPLRGRIKLDLPDIADGGASIRMMVSVEDPVPGDAPMTDILVVADSDPGGKVAMFHFAPASGITQVTTRIRLHSSQRVTAIAKMSDGSVYMSSKKVKVALGGWNW